MNYIDIIIAIPLLYALYKGWTKGLIIEVATLTALLLGIFLAVNYSDYAKDLLTNNLDISSSYMGYIAFIVTFIAAVVVINIFGKMLSKLIHAIALGMVNRILGSVFSIAKVLVILCILVTLFEGFDSRVKLVKLQDKENSKLYYPIFKLANTLSNSFNIGELTEEVKRTTDKLI
jgi:membrane protein required for colicin V production